MSGRRRMPVGLQVLASSLLTAGALGLGELLMGILEWPDPGLYEGDRAVVWWLRPNLDRTVTDPLTEREFRVRTSDLGLREPVPATDTRWTLAVGCSTTFGWGVEGDEAWPAQLSALTHAPVVNGGVPGWSTAQAVRGIERLWGSENPPARVILAFGVRDAQLAARPDSAARPTPLLFRTHWGQLLQSLRASRSASKEVEPIQAGPARVSPSEFGENTAQLVTMVEEIGAAAVVVFFPQPEPWPPPGYLEALHAAVPQVEAVVPKLDRDDFFEQDPIHLRPTGHTRLAQELALDPRLHD